MSEKLDVLAFGAHPDDVELTVGGTLLVLKEQGYRTGIVDMTRGEMATRGTPEIRAAESDTAGKLLGATLRRNLELPDGRVTLNEESRRKVIEVLRDHRPTIVLAPVEEDLHPDHLWTGRIVREACFISGLLRWDTGQAPHRPRTVLGYASHTVFEPSMVVDISPHFERKKEACLAYRSQFYDPDSEEPATYISSERFWDWWEARARHFGHRIGATFGEPFHHQGPIPVRDVVSQFLDFGYYPSSSHAAKD
jgi:bacillithiol biosynthesis deacetylase BshB1